MLGEVLQYFSLILASLAVTLNAGQFRACSYVGRLGGPDPEAPLGDQIIHPVLRDPTSE